MTVAQLLALATKLEGQDPATEVAWHPSFRAEGAVAAYTLPHNTAVDRGEYWILAPNGDLVSITWRNDALAADG
jgi:hypothetical protein